MAVLAPDIPQRPRGVAVIGWTTIALSVFLSAKALLDVAVWKAMGSAMPKLFESAGGGVQQSYLHALAAHLVEIKLAQAALWVGTGITAAALLRLRPWARVAMQAAGGLVLAYLAGFICLWVMAWSRSPSMSRLSDTSRFAVLLGGVLVVILFAALVAAMIVTLRREPVRRVFESAAGRAASESR